MNRRLAFALALSVPLLMVGTIFVTSRHAALSAEARRLEAAQEDWVDQNAKLEASVSVLSSRERIAAWAERLGLVKAKPSQRVLVLPPAAAATGGSNE